MKNWNATDAKQRFAELIASVVKEPQALYRRGKPVSVMISYEDFTRSHLLQQKRTTAAWLQELREICREEDDMDDVVRSDREQPAWDD